MQKTLSPPLNLGFYAIAIHAGAGSINSNTTDAEKQRYLEGLRHAILIGQHELSRGRSAVDAVECAVRASKVASF